LPGVATASEIMAAREAGFDDLKFFPAETSGGAAAVAAFAGPFPMARFCPTGGITQANAPRYLALANVACVGGSWLAPRDLVARRDWAEIEARARAAAALARG
jgi:2-dehydro-3-deoxyphosphogluconate aldolase/(4S)-4-hydroxy-2-oxoglutarate aldolase